MLAWLLIPSAQGGDPTVPFSTEPLWQYGALGVFASICVYAVYKLFNNLTAAQKAELDRIQAAHAAEMERLQAAHRAELVRIEAAHQAAIARADGAYQNEVARGNRLEGGLGDLNQLINTKMAGVLANATDAIREALEMQRDRRRQ